MMTSPLSNQPEADGFHEMNQITKRDNVSIAHAIERSLISIR